MHLPPVDRLATGDSRTASMRLAPALQRMTARQVAGKLIPLLMHCSSICVLLARYVLSTQAVMGPTLPQQQLMACMSI